MKEHSTQSPDPGTPDLSFAAFLKLALSGSFAIHDLLHEQYTYESWLRDQTLIEPLRAEYYQSAESPWGTENPGNFYDWLVEFKRVELTTAEESLRIHKRRE